MRLIETPNPRVHYDADTCDFIVDQEQRFNSFGLADLMATHCRDGHEGELVAQNLIERLETQAETHKDAWRRICEALDKHHPEWIDGNGTAIEKVITWISNKR